MRVLGEIFAHHVDLLVQLSAVMEPVLPGAGDGERDALGMPTPDTRDLAEPSVGLAREAGDAPSLYDTLEPVALCDAADVQALGLLEDAADWNLALHELLGERDLLGGVLSAVDLDLHEESLALADVLVVELSHLCMGEQPDHGALLDDLLLLSLDGLGADWRGEGGAVLGEGALAAVVPVLVEPAAALLAEVLRPHGADAAEPVRGLLVSDKANAHHRRGLNNGNGLDDFLLVRLAAGAVGVADDVCHAGLEADEGGEVWLDLLVVLRE